MGSSEIASSFAEELQQNLADFQTAVEAMLQSYKDSLHVYSDLMMRNELNQLEMHVSQNDLTEMHQNARKAAIEQVWNYWLIIARWWIDLSIFPTFLRMVFIQLCIFIQ